MGNENWILPYIRQYRHFFIVSILLGALTIACGGALMFTSGYLISKAATQPESILMVYVPIVGVRTFGIGRAVLSYVERLSGHSLILKILSNMRVKLYKMIEPQALLIHQRFRTGDILGLLANDIEHLQDFYLKTIFPSVVSLVIYVMMMISIGIFSVPFAILLAVLVGLLLFVGPAISLLVTKARNERLKRGRHELYYKFTDAVFGISDWIFSRNYQNFISDYENKEQQLYKIEVKKQIFVNWRDCLNQLVLGIVVVLVMAWANGLTVRGEAPATFIAAFCLAIFSLLESFLPISGVVSETTSYQESLRRLTEIEPTDSPIINTTVEKMTMPVTVQLNKVSFGYLQEDHLLKEVSLTIQPGEKLAILGRSGSGKSTLLHLIQGALAPTSGQVLLNERDAFTLANDMSSIISVLNQKAYLFHTSVMNNIRLGNPNSSDEEVFRVCKLVQLDDMIRNLPNGYETNMQETGQRFSGGERQRIALARILLQNTPIVLLDEPTVGLDPITENQLLTTIFSTLKDKTIIWVTHHLIGVEQMDRVLFLEKGAITMVGSHEQLLNKEQRYRNLYQLDNPFR
ncbi:thiol reductant ABC exporter subunit CydC [Neobacillus sp. LXY-1]|uniref:thiol reductant ABC exporter subunit CydC n=1 Tax=Neobacillus sp. LXY-1 TaxID=3379133 RepID=UPI003EDFA13E